MLVTKRRREPGAEPWRFAQRIHQSPYRAAFPSAVSADPNDRARWTATVSLPGHPSFAIPFFAVSARTAAESAVVLAGMGPSADLDQLAKLELQARSDIPTDPELVQALFGISQQPQPTEIA